MAHIWDGKQMKFSKKSKNESSILDNEMSAICKVKGMPDLLEKGRPIYYYTTVNYSHANKYL